MQILNSEGDGAGIGIRTPLDSNHASIGAYYLPDFIKNDLDSPTMQ